MCTQAKIQISLRIRAVWSESSLGAVWIAKDEDAKFLYADKEYPDQTARMRRLIWVFFGQHVRGTFSNISAKIVTGLVTRVGYFDVKESRLYQDK